MKKIILGLLIIIAILISIDIFTGIFYWNRLNLDFSSDSFNDIVTPIISFFAFVTYAITLIYLIKQNKIILSQNLKPHYEKEYNLLVKKAKKTIIEKGIIKPKKYNALNIVNAIYWSLYELTDSSNYNEDLEYFKEGKRFDRDYYKKRDYYENLLFLLNFTIDLNIISFFQENVITFKNEIKNSKLIQEDKSLFNNKIDRVFFSSYISLIEDMDKREDFFPSIPMIYNFDGEIIFRTINRTDFRKIYEKINTSG
jgi:hypothetical protein